MVGTNMGAGQVTRAEHIGWLGAGAAGVLTGAVGLLLALFPDSWVGLFTDHPPTLAAGVAYMTYAGPSLWLLRGGPGALLRFPGAGRGMACYCDAPTFSRCRWGRWVALNHFALGLNGIYLAAALGMVIYGSPSAASLALGAWRPRDGKHSEAPRRPRARAPLRARSTRLRRQEAIGEALGPKPRAKGLKGFPIDLHANKK